MVQALNLRQEKKGMKGAIEKAKELLATTPGSWMPQQFDNSANIDVHVRTTAQEIQMISRKGSIS